MPLFFELKRWALTEVSRMFELREYGTTGTVIYGPGVPADELYILVKGRSAFVYETPLSIADV